MGHRARNYILLNIFLNSGIWILNAAEFFTRDQLTNFALFR
jgi:hypothetical protein